MDPSAQVKRVHYYHAEAHALGGVLDTPFIESIPIQAPLSLPAVGGYGTAKAEKFNLKGVLSFDSAYTQVAGSVSKKPTGGWSTLVTSVIENVRVLDIFTADRIVAQISTEHPFVGYYPRVSFVGTRFEGVRIGGFPVTVNLDLDICNTLDGTDRYPKTACVNDKRFLTKVAEQYHQITGNNDTPQLIREQFANAPTQSNTTGHVLCSIVKSVTGQFPGKSYGHILEVPSFGKIFLGELIVNCESFNLSMVRLELGCATQGKVSATRVVINGSTYP